ncbi:MAG: TetR family transcriptional regulator [Tannerella sp.]|nr:TetR family transcriptional regulator [Tannerella sp.]
MLDFGLLEQNVENRIIEAARRVFYEKGYNGAGMRETARKAGVNYALLHYYPEMSISAFSAGSCGRPSPTRRNPAGNSGRFATVGGNLAASYDRTDRNRLRF